MIDLITDTACDRGFDVAISTTISGISSALVIVHKTMMSKSMWHRLAVLKLRGCILVGDPLDGQFSPDDLRLFDAFFTASFRQADWLRLNLPTKPCHFVNQRLDKRFPSSSQQSSAFSVGYFGAIENFLYKEVVSDIVDYIDTPTTDTDWMRKLPQYSAHYAVRPIQNDIFKPFGKGYIASKYGAVLIVGRNEPDATYLLPSDYPYFVDESSSDTCMAVLNRARDEFGSSKWLYAINCLRGIDRHASDEKILEQFFYAVADIKKQLSSRKAREAFALWELCKYSILAFLRQCRRIFSAICHKK